MSEACAHRVAVAAAVWMARPAKRGRENRSGRRQLALEEELGNEMPPQTWQHRLLGQENQRQARWSCGDYCRALPGGKPIDLVR